MEITPTIGEKLETERGEKRRRFKTLVAALGAASPLTIGVGHSYVRGYEENLKDIERYENNFLSDGKIEIKGLPDILSPKERKDKPFWLTAYGAYCYAEDAINRLTD